MRCRTPDMPRVRPQRKSLTEQARWRRGFRRACGTRFPTAMTAIPIFSPPPGLLWRPPWGSRINGGSVETGNRPHVRVRSGGDRRGRNADWARLRGLARRAAPLFPEHRFEFLNPSELPQIGKVQARALLFHVLASQICAGDEELDISELTSPELLQSIQDSVDRIVAAAKARTLN